MLSAIANWTCRREEPRLVGRKCRKRLLLRQIHLIGTQAQSVPAAQGSDQVNLELNCGINKILQSTF